MVEGYGGPKGLYEKGLMPVSIEAKVVTDIIAMIKKDFPWVEIDKLKRHAHLMDELGFSSLDMVEFAINLEEKFELSVSEDKFDRIFTIQQAANLIMKCNQVRAGSDAVA